MKKYSPLIIVLLFNLLMLNPLYAQKILKIAAVKGKVAIIRKPTELKLQKGETFVIKRQLADREIDIGKAKVMIIRETVIGIKLIELFKNTSIQKGDYIVCNTSDNIANAFNSFAGKSEYRKDKKFRFSELLKGFALTSTVGTMGLGGELTKRITSNVNIRFGVNRYNHFLTGVDSTNNLDYEATLHWNSLSAMIDWYPYNTGFRLGTGVIINNNSVDLAIRSTETYEYGSVVYTPDEIGVLNGTASFDKIAPYIGIGLGNSVSPGKKISFVFDLGVIYQNSPHVDFDANGIIAPSAEQDKMVEEDLKGWQAYGILTFGISIKLF